MQCNFHFCRLMLSCKLGTESYLNLNCLIMFLWKCISPLGSDVQPTDNDTNLFNFLLFVINVALPMHQIMVLLLLLLLLFSISYPGFPLQFCWAVINVGPDFLAKHLQRSLAELAVISNFHQRRPHRGMNSESFDTKLNALTGWPSIHKNNNKYLLL